MKYQMTASWFQSIFDSQFAKSFLGTRASAHVHAVLSEICIIWIFLLFDLFLVFLSFRTCYHVPVLRKNHRFSFLLELAGIHFFRRVPSISFLSWHAGICLFSGCKDFPFCRDMLSYTCLIGIPRFSWFMWSTWKLLFTSFRFFPLGRSVCLFFYLRLLVFFCLEFPVTFSYNHKFNYQPYPWYIHFSLMFMTLVSVLICKSCFFFLPKLLFHGNPIHWK